MSSKTRYFTKALLRIATSFLCLLSCLSIFRRVELKKSIKLSDIFLTNLSTFETMECAKTRGPCAIESLMRHVPQCYCAFVDPKIFLVGISWVPDFFSR